MSDNEKKSLKRPKQPSAAQVGVRGKTLHGQCRQMLCNLFDYFKREKEAGGPLGSVSNVMQRACDASGVSASTLRRSLRERTLAEIKREPIPTPGRTRPRNARVTNMKKADIVGLREIVRKFYLDGKVPTLKKVLAFAKRDLKYAGGNSSFNRIMKTKMGYHYATLTKGGPKYLLERDDIGVLRRQFLRKMRAFRAKGRSLVYVDETWFSERGAACWQDDQGKGELCCAPWDKGPRLVVLHAGTEAGFVPDAKLILEADASDEGGLSASLFADWFQRHLLPNVPPNSVIVLDGASCHSQEVHAALTCKSRRSEMADWLTTRGVSFDAAAAKSALYALVKQSGGAGSSSGVSNGSGSGHQRYVVDELARAAGHQVLRLPPFFDHFNPMDAVWTLLQERMARRRAAEGGATTPAALKTALEEEMDRVGAAEWSAAAGRAAALQSRFWQEDELIEMRIAAMRALGAKTKGAAAGQEEQEEQEEQDEHEQMEVERGREVQVTVEKQHAAADFGGIAEFCPTDMTSYWS